MKVWSFKHWILIASRLTDLKTAGKAGFSFVCGKKDFGNLPKDKVLLVEHEMCLHFNFLFFHILVTGGTKAWVFAPLSTVTQHISCHSNFNLHICCRWIWRGVPCLLEWVGWWTISNCCSENSERYSRKERVTELEDVAKSILLSKILN